MGEHRALFIDRDGTLCRLVPYLERPDQIELLPGAAAALARAAARGWHRVVVTNQSGIARGLFTLADVEAVHREIDRQLAAAGAAIDRYEVCPHHPDHTGPCGCRKPAPGLILTAARALGIDPRRSVMIGDTIEDLLAGAAAGCSTFLVLTGYGREQQAARRAQLPPATRIVSDLAAAIEAVLAAADGDQR